MNHWLVYWKTYWEEMKSRPRPVTPNWHSSHEQLYHEARPGDVIWVVVSGGMGNEIQWRLLEHFSLRTKENVNDSPKGHKYRFEGDDDSHEVFDPRAPNDFTPILTGLSFASHHPIRFSGRKIGQAIQSPRKLAALDGMELSNYAKGLPRVPRGVARAG